MENKNSSSCSALVMFLFLGYVVFQVFRFLISQIIKTIQYFESPNNVEQFIYDLKAVGVCFGVILLTITLLRLYFMIFPSKNGPHLQFFSEEYPVRCILIEKDGKPDNQSLDATHNKLEGEPVYLLFSRTNFGMSLRPISAQYTWSSIYVDNESRYLALSNNHPGRIILPFGYTYLYYRQVGELKIESYPGNGDGYSGSLPEDSGNRSIEIVIAYSAVLEEENLHHILSWEQVLKFRLVVLDKDGQGDEEATRKLYNDIYEFMNPTDTSYDDYEYYRHRPPWYY